MIFESVKMSVQKVLSFANVGKGSIWKRPTILVVSPAGFIDHMKDALLAENKQQCTNILQFIFCEHVEEVLALTSHNSLSPVDYIVLVLDPRDSTCITMAEENISKIDPTYIEAGRVCFVNGACSLPPVEKSIPLGHINVVSQKYSVMLINGDVLKPEDCLNLSSRIIQLVSVVFGIHSGVPMSVDIPGYF